MTLKNLNSPYLLGLANLANYEASCFRQWVEPGPKDAHMISQLCLVRRKQYWPFWEYADFVEFYVIKL